ncbi:MAG: efflux RND transporter periplasmic adaptor subunit, partial [Clostridiales bacterium]|nr:efflux RND transporter periplasmic adaptor subunit [Clostridiales bacterium]
MNEATDSGLDTAKTAPLTPEAQITVDPPPLPKRPKRSRGGLILLIVFLLAIGGAAYWRLVVPKEQLELVPEQAVQVYTAKARLDNIAVKTVLTGKVRASEEVMVFAPSTAEVRHIYVEKGDHVSAGDRLFSLDGAQMQSGYTQAQTARDMAEEGVEMARANLERMQALYDSAAIPQAQLEQAENQFSQAQNQLRQAEAALSGVSTSLNLLNFTAPVAGHITEVNIKEGMYPMQQLPAVSIASLDDLEIAASVSEYLIGQLKEDDIVSYRIDSLGGATYTGRIKSVALAPATGTITYPITVGVMETGAGIKPGMFAELSIPSQQKENALVIPVAALITRGGVTSVAVLTGDLPYMREVTTGINNGEMVEITFGLSPGETVITKGQHYI